jgi:hypothetical protein
MHDLKALLGPLSMEDPVLSVSPRSTDFDPPPVGDPRCVSPGQSKTERDRDVDGGVRTLSSPNRPEGPAEEKTT